jgi:hypothetical protein
MHSGFIYLKLKENIQGNIFLTLINPHKRLFSERFHNLFLLASLYLNHYTIPNLFYTIPGLLCTMLVSPAPCHAPPPLQFAKENSRTLRKDLRDLSAPSADLISLVLKQLYRIFQKIHLPPINALNKQSLHPQTDTPFAYPVPLFAHIYPSYP